MKVVKKIFKVLSILVVIVVLCIGLFIGFLLLSRKIEDIKNNNERINNSKTLSQYITNHNIERLNGDLDKYAIENFVLKDFKCDAIKDKEIIFFNGNILVLSDYTIYDVLLDNNKLYSNNQQCKKVDTGNIEIDGISYFNYEVVFKANDNLYRYITTADNQRRFEDYNNPSSKIKEIINNNYSIINYNDNIYYTIKDGNIYKLTLSDNTYKIKSEELFISKEEYGYIISAEMSNIIQIGRGKTRNIDFQITQLITDKGIYILRQKNNQDCEKYVDVSCEYELVLSDIYSKYSKDVRYLGKYMSILNDNNIIKTSIFFNELDKEVK